MPSKAVARPQALFVELDVPIAKSLDLDISDREDRYSDFGRTNNAKVSVRYQPIDILTLRGTASTGFRAPTLYDLYSPNFLAASSSGTMEAATRTAGPLPPLHRLLQRPAARRDWGCTAETAA